MSELEVVPVTFAEASAFVAALHRHHKPAVGMKFAIGVARDGELVGVLTAGRPVAKAYQDGRTLEVNRTCTDGTANANSALYGAAWRAAKALGYRRIITYNQDGESGASLRGAGYHVLAERPGRGSWDTPSRRRTSPAAVGIARTLWEAS